jgi:glycyl-tRNA synthetase
LTAPGRVLHSPTAPHIQLGAILPTMSNAAEPANLMEALVSLAKRRGFIYPSSEIYGGLNGFFDYGPLGSELKKNIRDCWWNDMVRRRDDVVGLESSIIMHPKVWEASGHVRRLQRPARGLQGEQAALPRRPAVLVARHGGRQDPVGYVSALESENTAGELQAAAELLKRKKAITGRSPRSRRKKDFTEAAEAEIPLMSPATDARPAA